jgi:hypothetical protein
MLHPQDTKDENIPFPLIILYIWGSLKYMEKLEI